jgi:putative iron-regulated protein
MKIAGSAVITLGLACAGYGADAKSAPDVSLLKREALTNYADLAALSYDASVAGAQKLQAAVLALVQHPSERALADARTTWKAARVPYSRTEAFRFCDGPIDKVESRINSWPIDEQYIDYVEGAPQAGIINDARNFPTLSREVVISLNEKEGKKNISTGFHAIEFLLWGQDLSASGPGNRSWRDYEGQANNAARRREYLVTVTSLLVDDLKSVADAWHSGAEKSYRSEFLGEDTGTALSAVIRGLGALSGSELAGERLTTPYETKEQEEEQDCFSDNTCNDLGDDAVGIREVFSGGLPASSQQRAALHKLLMAVDPALAEKVAKQIDESVAAVAAIPSPFDQAILGANSAPGRLAIKKAIASLRAQSDLLAEAAKALGLKLVL